MGANIKGASLLSCIAVSRQVAGGRFELLIQKCPIPTQQLLRRTILAVEWVPVEVWSPFLRQMLEQLANHDEGRFRRLMRPIYKRDFSSVYRAYVMGAGHLDILNKLESIWRAYFDAGSLSLANIATVAGRAQATLLLRSFPSTDNIYLALVHALLEELFGIVGMPSAVVARSNEQRYEGGIDCDYQVTF